MKRFFLISLLALLLLATGCTCSVRGSATMPTQRPTAPASTSAPTTAATPAATAAPETIAPVEPTATPASSEMPSATAGN